MTKTHEFYGAALEAVEDKVYHKMGHYKQFTIDLIEELTEEIGSNMVKTEEYSASGSSEEKEKPLPLETLIGSLSYRVSTALEICDKNLEDYALLEEIYKILND